MALMSNDGFATLNGGKRHQRTSDESRQNLSPSATRQRHDGWRKPDEVFHMQNHTYCGRESKWPGGRNKIMCKRYGRRVL
jgi:hypothetical protein